MVYLAESLVVMTDGLKIVRIRAWNVHCVHVHRRLDDDASLDPGKLGCHPVEAQRNHPGTTCACLAVASKQESCHNSMPSSLW